MGLWSAVVDSAGRLNADRMVDSLTCECCPTAAAATSRGPVVVYRDRDQAGNDVRYDQAVIRDISLVRLEGDHWTRPHPVHRDNWVFNGCPDNGPAVDAAGDTVVVAWWTAAQQQPRVQVAFSDDAGNSFGDPFRIDRRRGEGQVTLVIVPGGAIVGWLEEGRTWARWVARDGRLGALSELGLSPRRARLPRWIAQGDTVFAGWTEEAGGKAERVRLDRLRLVRR
jgi:hypothetical protein